jgi:serine protease inhibitor
MLVILPEKLSSLEKVEESLRTNYFDPNAIIDKLKKNRQIRVEIPKFKIESTLDPIPALTQVR